MKLDPHMEIDRLLHRHARQQQSPLAPMAFASRDESDDGGEAVREPEGFTHLDADELSAYAENALPPSARARYTGHLANCDSCRKLVTELALSSGIATQLEQQAAPQAVAATDTISGTSKNSWHDWLRSMFAPTRLRYAASIIVVIGILAIAVTIFRNRRMGFETTRSNQNEDTQTKSAPVNSNAAPLTTNNQNTTEGGVAAPTTASSPSAQAKPDANSAPQPQSQEAQPQSPVVSEAQKSGAAQGPAGESPAPPPAVSNNNFELPKNSSRDEDNEIAKTAQPTIAAPSEDARKAKKENDAADSADDVGRAQANRERTASSKTAAQPENKQQYGKAEESSARRARGSVAASSPKDAPSASASGAASGVSLDGQDKSNSPAKPVEKRSVGGRQFVRRGSAWVDASYKAQATTNVRRGTEQYRALAADEPGLRDIADQLGGEVIIVWKGRAYRIH